MSHSSMTNVISASPKPRARCSCGVVGLTTDDIQKAILEETDNIRASNLAVTEFIRAASTTGSTVVGSDASRYRFRSQTWGTSVVLGNPSFFLTINLADHRDPIAQYLPGEDVDLDNFLKALGQAADDRSRNIVQAA